MKKILFTLLIAMHYSLLPAQSIGIGTTSPNTKAMLDISSNSKGVLFPRMSTSERLGISSPPNGLLVYDTDKDEFYHYNGIGWRVLVNGEYWSRPITSRSRIANATDSVGIGTSSPTEWLDVDGNIRSRNNLLADGTLSAASVVSTGNLVTVGTSLLSGDVTTNSDLIMNNAGATLQLRNGSINKGFFQLSGDNIRMGTNSGNSTGNLVIRMNGADRVFVNEDGNVGVGDANPTHKLEVNGNINLTGELVRTSLTGTASLTPHCYGNIRMNGAIQGGTGNFAIQRLQQGYYRIHCTGLTFSNSIVIATAGHRTRIITAFVAINDYIDVIMTDLFDDEIDGDFYFVVFRI